MDVSKRQINFILLNGSPHHNFYHKFISRNSNVSKTMKAQKISAIKKKLVSPYIMIVMKNMI